MPTFRDSQNRTWSLTLNCANIEAVQSRCQINVLDIEDPQSDLLERLIDFPPLACQIVEALLAEDLERANVSPADFRRAMSGDAIAEALDGLREELIAFFPKSRRSLLRTVREKQRAVEETGLKLALEKLADPALMEAAEQQLRRQIQAQMDKVLAPEVSTSELSRVPPPRVAEVVRLPPQPAPSAPASWTPATRPPASWASTPAGSPGESCD